MVIIWILLIGVAFILGWVFGASKASCPADRQFDEYGKSEERTPHLRDIKQEKYVGGIDPIKGHDYDKGGVNLNQVTDSMAEYIILNQGWTVKTMGETGEMSKIIGRDNVLVTKQAVPTAELNKWICDNFEPDGSLKNKEI